MKSLTCLLIAAMLAFGFFFGASAQGPESIWIETGQTSYGAGETIVVTLNAQSATPIQGFSFQLRYDPACLQPEAPTGLLAGINLMAVPQTAGLVDGIFAGPTQATAKGGPVAEVKFKALAACQTTLNLEGASLIVPNASGIAVALSGISLGTRSLSLNVGGQGAAGPQASSPAQAGATAQPGATPGATPASREEQAGRLFRWLILPLLILLGAVLVIGLLTALALVFARGRQSLAIKAARAGKNASLFIQRGPGAGTSLPLVVFPCRMGSDPENEIRLSETRVAPLHAQILSEKGVYALVDLGSQEGTSLNGRQLTPNQPIPLKAGDVLRLGGVLLVFKPTP